MKFLIISHVVHKIKEDKICGYAPYVREMNLWLKYVDEVEVVAPFVNEELTNIDLAYKHDKLKLTQIPSLAFTSLKQIFFSTIKLPVVLKTLFKACKRANHIHLRCPGNVGLLGCLIQVLFPEKVKTAKYAGNWDPQSKQPLSYRLQKKILSNTFLSKNMTVLVYGKWNNQSKNIKSFFTATFKDSEKELYIKKEFDKLWNFVFVGSLVKGKRPMLAVKIVEKLHKQQCKVKLNIYGDGILMDDLKKYVNQNNLNNIVILHGNQSKEIIKQAYRDAHFSLLLSKSEGWPKALAEAMFFGVIPIATLISCVPYMLDYGKRGIIVEPLEEKVFKALMHIKPIDFESMSINAISWSQKYTLDVFEKEIKKLI